MAYKALYRTYRPNTFDEVVGQKHIVKTLKNAVETHKIAHAYLFCGPRGTGKTSIAKIFAKAVNCTGNGNHPCMACENCLAITDGSHPDIVEIDAASNNGVEEVRNLIEKVKYAPIKGIYKVYIIDEVHMMSAGAFNALLKTIEEPPAHVIFILATTEPQKVLPTIISRCQRFDFTKIPMNEIEARLRIGLTAENIHCEEEVIRMVAQLSDGGMRDAWSIMDQCIAYAQNDIQVKHINEIYGMITTEEKLTLLEMVINQDAGACMNFVQQLMEKSIDVRRLTMDLIELIKESIVYDYTQNISLLHKIHREEAEALIGQADRNKRFHMIETLMDAYDKYRNAADISSYFEVCLLKMMEQSSTVSESSAQTQMKQKTQSQIVSRETIVNESEKQVQKNEETSAQEQSQKKEISETIDNKTTQPLDDEYVLRLLVGANKPEKQADQFNFQNIREYAMDLHWAREANLIRSGTIMASGETYLIITVGSQAEANEINEKDSQDAFADFTKELFHKTKKIFAVTIEQSKRITDDFRNRMAEGTLPDALSFTFDCEEAEPIDKEPTKEEAILDLFGTDNVIITED